MDYYKSKCSKCGRFTCWMGPNHFFVKIDYPICFHCGTQTREQDKTIDRQSVMGRTYEKRIIEALMTVPDVIDWEDFNKP